MPVHGSAQGVLGDSRFHCQLDHSRRFMKRAIAALGFLTLVGTSTGHAGAVDANRWYQFCFGAAGTFATSNSAGNCVAPFDLEADLPPWTFSSTTSFRFIVQDLFLSGDQFSLFDALVEIGQTSVPAGGGGCGNNPVTCQGDPRFSRGEFLLGAGSYSFRIRADQSPFGSGGAGFRIEPTQVVPEPGSMGLVAIGLVGLGTLRRRRKRMAA